MVCDDCFETEECRCGPGEMCGVCFESRVKPEDVPRILTLVSEPEKPILRCKCGARRTDHDDGAGACYSNTCMCAEFRCDHTRCGWKPREEPERAAEVCRCAHNGAWHPYSNGEACTADGCTCEVFRPRREEPKRLSLTAACACSHVNNWHVRADHNDTHCAASDCPCGAFRASSEAEEPPLTPEEEEEASEPCSEHPDAPVIGGVCGGCTQYPEDMVAKPPQPERDPLWQRIEDAVYGYREKMCQWDESDGTTQAIADAVRKAVVPQPDRRPPYVVSYSVQGHLFEVALSGDATIRAVDGALVIQHHLGPIAGIVSVLPVINKESA